jgi:hypothetical protein
MKADERLVQLMQREVELLLRYAYPFETEASLHTCRWSILGAGSQLRSRSEEWGVMNHCWQSFWSLKRL